MADDIIAGRARRLFQGPLFPIVVSNLPVSIDYPEIPEMRFDGQRWVDATRPDRPMVAILPKPVSQDGDIFGGSGMRQPPRPEPKLAKTRRRGGF